MDNYRKIAIRYLKMNKKRSVIATIGVVITTTILFAFLNVMCGLLVNYRNVIRETENYEMFFFLESEEQGERILGDSRVKSAYIGPYYKYTYNAGEDTLIHENTLFVNVTQPYRINAIFKSLCEDYQVEGEINDYLAATYFQGVDEEGMVAAALFVLLIAYIFAIFGVGIVRNAIQLCALENIRDYGNLRCIGASKGQLKGIIYLQGAILELIGIAIGIVMGTIVTFIVGAIAKMEFGFHPIGILLILIVFMGDLYFTMGENSRLITGMSPLSAIRGEYRIKKEKIKLRDKNLFGKLFGVEGNYAYKSLMRNRGRFFRTIGAMTFGIGMFIAIAGFVSTISNITKTELESYKYYQIYYENMLEPGESIELVQSTLPSVENLARLSEAREVTEAKRIYSSVVTLVDLDAHQSRFTEEYLSETMQGSFQNDFYNYCQEADSTEGGQRTRRIYSSLIRDISCYGYDESDMERYKSALVAGTLDVSDHGIIIVNEGKMFAYTEDDYAPMEYVDSVITDYQIGDTIDLIDMQKYYAMLEDEIEALEEETEVKKEQLQKELGNSEIELLDALDELQQDMYEKKQNAVYECWNTLIENGDYKSYTIEGIVNEDVNHFGQEFRIILPKEKYFALTGTDETMNTGMQYHIDRIPLTANLANLCMEIAMSDYDEYMGIEYDACEYSGYIWYLSELQTWKNTAYVILMIVVFVVLMASLNFINSTASNLHLRRKEFAQLRVIGTSKERLMKMVLLEGVITTVISNVLGVSIGSGICCYVFYFINLLYKVDFHFPFAAVIGCIIGSFLLLCGSIYVPMRQLSQSMVSDLTTGGD